jgi:hypothetical protein
MHRRRCARAVSSRSPPSATQRAASAPIWFTSTAGAMLRPVPASDLAAYGQRGNPLPLPRCPADHAPIPVPERRRPGPARRALGLQPRRLVRAAEVLQRADRYGGLGALGAGWWPAGPTRQRSISTTQPTTARPPCGGRAGGPQLTHQIQALIGGVGIVGKVVVALEWLKGSKRIARGINEARSAWSVAAAGALTAHLLARVMLSPSARGPTDLVTLTFAAVSAGGPMLTGHAANVGAR